MKIKILCCTFLVLTNYVAKATDFNSSILRKAQIATIDIALEQAKTFEELKAVSFKMYELVLENYCDTCSVPDPSFYRRICSNIAGRTKAPESESNFYEYYYEKDLLEAACINIGIDKEETILKKLKLFWNKYKKLCVCDSLSFQLPNGNLLKYALAQKMPEVIETLADTYGLDINFNDPKDGLNLLDYILDEIEKLKKLPTGRASLNVWEEYKTRVIDLGGKSNRK